MDFDGFETFGYKFGWKIETEDFKIRRETLLSTIENKNDDMYRINVIYTYQNKEQEMGDIRVGKEYVRNISKEDFLKMMIDDYLNQDEFSKLIKISTCIYGVEKRDELPDWYTGKFFDFSTINLKDLRNENV